MFPLTGIERREADNNVRTRECCSQCLSPPPTQDRPNVRNVSLQGREARYSNNPTLRPSAAVWGETCVPFSSACRHATIITGTSVLHVVACLDTHSPPRTYHPTRHSVSCGVIEIACLRHVARIQFLCRREVPLRHFVPCGMVHRARVTKGKKKGGGTEGMVLTVSRSLSTLRQECRSSYAAALLFPLSLADCAHHSAANAVSERNLLRKVTKIRQPPPPKS